MSDQTVEKPKKRRSGPKPFADLANVGRLRAAYQDAPGLREEFRRLMLVPMLSGKLIEFLEVLAECSQEETGYAADLFDVIDKRDLKVGSA